MDDFITSIKAFLYDRTTSPLFGSVLLSWSVWNWEVILVLFSDKNFDDTVNYISQHFSKTGWTLEGVEIPNLYIGGILFPLLVAAAYIYLYPKVSLPVLRHSLAKRNEAKRVKISAQNEQPISEEESRKLFVQIAQLEEEKNEAISNYQNQINALNKELLAKDSQIKQQADALKRKK